MSSFILEDLNQLTKDCRNNYKNLPNKTDIYLTDELSKKLKPLLDQELNASTIISRYSIEYQNSSNQYAIFPSKWLWVALAFYPLKKAFEAYSEILQELKKIPDFKDKDFLKEYPMESEPSTKTAEQTKFETDALAILQSKDPINATANFNNFKKFIYERAWWNLGNVSTRGADKASGKSFDRSDLFKSTLLTATQFIVSTSEKIAEVINAVSQDKSLIADLNAIKSNINLGTSASSTTSLTSKIISNSTTPHIKSGKNVIYFGAPGTGKSDAIKKIPTDENNSVTTIFHPETYYSDFVGCLKPTMGTVGVEYKFQVGPFTEIIIKALNDPSHHYYLVIEEINRAKSAAVFGEIFQLLDRKDNGESEYSIQVNDQDLLKVFEQNLLTPLKNNRIQIPKNLSILATMNTSDQAVEPMDTAFKRRWKYVYKPIDFTTCATGNFLIKRSIGDITVTWKALAENINDFLAQLEIPEDRHLGPWFVKNEEISTLDKAKDTLGSKILMYLWDDVLRHEGKSELFTNEIKTYGQLISRLNKDEVIFNTNFSNLFK